MTQLSFPANPSNGQEYTDPNSKVWQFDGVKWDRSVSEAVKQFSGVKAIISSPVSLTATPAPINFSNTSYDVGNFWNVSTPSIITIPRTGYYRINFQVESGVQGSGNSYNTTLYINGVGFNATDFASNQVVSYDEILLFNAGDTVEIYGSEETAVGAFTTNTYLEIALLGYTFGSSIVPGFEFSGIKVDLASSIATTSTPSAISWTANDIQYNTNANAAGAVYWSVSNPTRFTIATTGYYRIQSNIVTGVQGSSDSYNINLRKNGITTVESASIGPLDILQLDETYYFTSTEYLELVISNTGNIGEITAPETSLSITRIGV